MRQIFVNNSTTVAGSGTLLNALADGKFAFFNAENMGAGALDLTSLTTAKSVVAAMGRASGKAPITSQPIPVDKIKSAVKRAYAAGAAQKTSLGFNGTTGSLGIDAILGALTAASVQPEYGIRFVDMSQGFEPYGRTSFSALGKPADREYDIALALLTAINANPVAPVTAELLVNQASTALTSARTVTVTNGSTSLTISGDTHGLVQGDAIRIGGTALTFPVYTVAAISGQNVTLNRPYLGASGSGVAASELNAAIDAQSCGLIFTSKVVGGSFNTSVIGDWPSTVVATIATTPATPHGTGEQLFKAFEDNAGRFGEFYRAYMPTDLENPVNKSLTYDIVTVEYDNEIDRHIARPAGVSELIVGIEAGGTLDLATFFGV